MKVITVLRVVILIAAGISIFVGLHNFSGDKRGANGGDGLSPYVLYSQEGDYETEGYYVLSAWPTQILVKGTDIHEAAEYLIRIGEMGLGSKEIRVEQASFAAGNVYAGGGGGSNNSGGVGGIMEVGGVYIEN